MNRSTQQLALPGGGYLELPMPDDMRTFVNAPAQMAGTTSDSGSVLVPVLIGGALGALLTWGFLKLIR